MSWIGFHVFGQKARSEWDNYIYTQDFPSLFVTEFRLALYRARTESRVQTELRVASISRYSLEAVSHAFRAMISRKRFSRHLVSVTGHTSGKMAKKQLRPIVFFESDSAFQTWKANIFFCTLSLKNLRKASPHHGSLRNAFNMCLRQKEGTVNMWL